MFFKLRYNSHSITLTLNNAVIILVYTQHYTTTMQPPSSSRAFSSPNKITPFLPSSMNLGYFNF